MTLHRSNQFSDLADKKSREALWSVKTWNPSKTVSLYVIMIAFPVGKDAFVDCVRWPTFVTLDQACASSSKELHTAANQTQCLPIPTKLRKTCRVKHFGPWTWLRWSFAKSPNRVCQRKICAVKNELLHQSFAKSLKYVRWWKLTPYDYNYSGTLCMVYCSTLALFHGHGFASRLNRKGKLVHFVQRIFMFSLKNSKINGIYIWKLAVSMLCNTLWKGQSLLFLRQFLILFQTFRLLKFVQTEQFV